MLRTKYKHIKLLLLGLPILTALLLAAAPSFAAADPNYDCDQTTCRLTCNDGTQTQVTTSNLGAGVDPGDAYSTSLTGGKTATEFCSKHDGIKSIMRLDGKKVAHSGGNAGDAPTNVECKDQNGKNYCSFRCGAQDENSVMTSINLGCKGKGNPILDMLFAFIRLLSYGVGLIIVGSMVVAGIQYTTSRGDPQATATAEKRIKANVAALLIFIFSYAILNYVIPGAVLGTQ